MISKLQDFVHSSNSNRGTVLTIGTKRNQISILVEGDLATHFCAWHAIYRLIEKPLGCYFQVWPPWYQTGQCNQKTPIPNVRKFFLIFANSFDYINLCYGSPF